jgi:long-chain fatty acid transport protein
MKKLVSALVVLSASAALAAGTNVDLQSARPMGMATAVVANSPDPSAVFFNPADIVDGGQSLRFQVGDTAIIPGITFTPTGSSTSYAVTNVVPPFTAYVTYGITKDLAVGIGVFEPYGLKITWPEDFPGRYITQKADLKTYYINPEVAYRFGVFKLGVGVQIIRGTVDLSQKLNFGTGTDGLVELGGGAWAVGGNAGIQAEILPGMLSAGLTYRSRANLDFTGNAHFSNIPVEFQGPGNGAIHDQGVEAKLSVPDSVALGISVQPMPTLRINAEVDYYAWQVFHDVTITFDDPSLNKKELKAWNHGLNYHLGGELDVTPNFSVRAGVMYDPTPSPSETLLPDVPDSDRVNLAAGVGYHSGGLSVDLAYQYIKFLGATAPASSPLPGEYGGGVNAVSLSLGYQL